MLILTYADRKLWRWFETPDYNGYISWRPTLYRWIKGW